MDQANPHGNAVSARSTHCRSRRVKQHLFLQMREVDSELEQMFRELHLGFRAANNEKLKKVALLPPVLQVLYLQ